MMKKDDKALLYVHHITEASYVNGPGKRAVVWTQGCSLGCKGCFNQTTHSTTFNGTYFDIEVLASKLANLKVGGLTISGGEPLDQSSALLRLLQLYKKRCQENILLFTGYTVEEILSSYSKRCVIQECDAVLAGRFVISAKHWEHKRLLLLTNRISSNEIGSDVPVELTFQEDMVTVTGYPDEYQVSLFNKGGIL